MTTEPQVHRGHISRRFWGLSQSYFDAAKLVSTSGNKLVPPFYLLLCHSLETSLKAYLAATGTSIDDLRNVGHRIVDAYNLAKTSGLPELSDHAVNAIPLLSEFHSANVFRYPKKNKDGSIVHISSVVNMPEAIEVVSEIRRSLQPRVIKEMLQSAAAGPYEVEYWGMGASADAADSEDPIKSDR